MSAVASTLRPKRNSSPTGPSAPPGGGARLTVVFRDSKGDPEEAREAFAELDALGAVVVIGPLDVEASRVVAQEAVARNLPMVSLSLDVGVVARGSHVFRFGVDVDREFRELVQLSTSRGQGRILVIRPEEDFSRELTQRFQDTLEVEGGSLVDTLTFEPDATDHRKLAKKAAKLSFDAVFLPTSPGQAAAVMSFLAQQDIWPLRPGFEPGPRDPRRFVTVYGLSTWYQDEGLFVRSGGRLEGAIFAVPYAREQSSDRNVVFVETFGKLYERLPGAYEAIAFDLMGSVRRLARENPGATRDEFLAQLQQMPDYEGVTGDWRFNDQGDASPTPLLMQMGAETLQILPPPIPALVPPVEDSSAPTTPDAFAVVPAIASEPSSDPAPALSIDVALEPRAALAEPAAEPLNPLLASQPEAPRPPPRNPLLDGAALNDRHTLPSIPPFGAGREASSEPIPLRLDDSSAPIQD